MSRVFLADRFPCQTGRLALNREAKADADERATSRAWRA
jgi:hypothetical protein